MCSGKNGSEEKIHTGKTSENGKQKATEIFRRNKIFRKIVLLKFVINVIIYTEKYDYSNIGVARGCQGL